MAATVCPAPKFVGLDNSGNPLSAGKLYSYLAGTSTALPTYSDSDLTVENTNPVILDAGGRATVYLSATSYKFVLKSSTDSVIYTQDNVLAAAPYNVDLDVPVVAGETITAGQAIYLSDGTGARTAGRWYLTDADTAAYSTLPITGFATTAIASGAEGSVRLLGLATVPGPLSVGSTYYLSGTPGALSTSVGTFAKAMGVADSSTTLIMTVQQTVSSTGNLLVTGTLTVTGATALQSTLAVTGVTTLTGGLNTPLVVAQGGSGRATATTAYAVLASGTTPTGAEQSIAPVAATYVLTDNGVGVLPSFQAAAGGLDYVQMQTFGG
jgi:hypothetical protein